MLEIVDEIDAARATGLYYDATRGQDPAYADRITFVRDYDDKVVVVSTLRPDDACNAIKAGCYCWLVADHDDDAHLCGCGGSWLPNGREIRNPGPFGVLDVMPEPEPLPLRVRRGLIEFLRPPTLGAPS